MQDENLLNNFKLSAVETPFGNFARGCPDVTMVKQNENLYVCIDSPMKTDTDCRDFA